MENILKTLNDTTVIPAVLSSIESRSECSPVYKNGMSPLFVSPMLNIINDENFHCFLENKINVVLPRDDERKPFQERFDRWRKYWNKVFVALSLNEFKSCFGYLRGGN